MSTTRPVTISVAENGNVRKTSRDDERNAERDGASGNAWEATIRLHEPRTSLFARRSHGCLTGLSGG
jgi:hypothetical protein